MSQCATACLWWHVTYLICYTHFCHWLTLTWNELQFYESLGKFTSKWLLFYIDILFHIQDFIMTSVYVKKILLFFFKLAKWFASYFSLHIHRKEKCETYLCQLLLLRTASFIKYELDIYDQSVSCFIYFSFLSLF